MNTASQARTPLRAKAPFALLAAFLLGFAPVGTAANRPVSTGSMDFDGVITSVVPGEQGCQYSARLEANVATTADTNPENFTARLQADWEGACQQEALGSQVSGSADIRFTSVQTTADSNPENFTLSGSANKCCDHGQHQPRKLPLPRDCRTRRAVPLSRMAGE